MAVIENKQQGGAPLRKVDQGEHGRKLSAGLQEIVDAYSKLQGTSSVTEEDLRVFEVFLPVGGKLSALKDFLAEQGMSINFVTPEGRGMVTSSKSSFEGLQKRINDYRDAVGAKYKYSELDGFSFPTPQSKQSRSIREVVESTIGAVQIDVEFMLLPHLEGNDKEKMRLTVIKRIQTHEGSLITETFTLTDGTPIIRANVPVKSINDVSSEPAVCRVTRTAYLSTAPAYQMAADVYIPLDETVNIDELPIVAVLDTGVEFADELSSLIVEHWTPSGATGGDCVHGTAVAGKIAFLNLMEQLNDTGKARPRARIIDCNIRGVDPTITDPDLVSDTVMIERIREAVETFSPITKIFNLSSAAMSPIEGDDISILGYELDVLSNTYGVKFVLAAGNHMLFKTQGSLEDIFDDDDSRIATPADSMLNITVGSIVGKDYKNSLSGAYDVAPYSRIGPGFAGFRKPDIVALSATVLKTGHVPSDEYSTVLAPNSSIRAEMGTSYAAPVVAGDLAEIMSVIPNCSPLLAETLLYHGAFMPPGKADTRDDAAYFGDRYGRGLPQPLVSMYSNCGRVTFIHSGKLSKKYKQHVKFHMPNVYDGVKLKKGNSKIKVRVTCVTQPPIDKSRGPEYLGAYVFTSLHYPNSRGTDQNAKVTKSDCRKKWDTCYHFETSLSSFQSGDWEVWLQLYTRWFVKETDEVEYALAVTIEDLTKDVLAIPLDLYNAIIVETKGRYKPIQTLRLPVR